MFDGAPRNEHFLAHGQVLAELGCRVHRVAEIIYVAREQQASVVDADRQVNLFADAEGFVGREHRPVCVEAGLNGVIRIPEKGITVVGFALEKRAVIGLDDRRDYLPGAVNHLEKVTDPDLARGTRKACHVRDKDGALGAELLPDTLANRLRLVRVWLIREFRDEFVEFVVPCQGLVKCNLCHVYPNLLSFCRGSNSPVYPDLAVFLLPSWEVLARRD